MFVGKIVGLHVCFIKKVSAAQKLRSQVSQFPPPAWGGVAREHCAGPVHLLRTFTMATTMTAQELQDLANAQPPIHPEGRALALFCIGIVLSVLSAVCVGLRLWGRAWKLRRSKVWGWDDTTAALGLVKHSTYSEESCALPRLTSRTISGCFWCHFCLCRISDFVWCRHYGEFIVFHGKNIFV